MSVYYESILYLLFQNAQWERTHLILRFVYIYIGNNAKSSCQYYRYCFFHAYDLFCKLITSLFLCLSVRHQTCLSSGSSYHFGSFTNPRHCTFGIFSLLFYIRVLASSGEQRGGEQEIQIRDRLKGKQKIDLMQIISKNMFALGENYIYFFLHKYIYSSFNA